MSIKPLADLFLRMIKMIIAPLLFSTLVVGIAGTGDLKTMGRIGLKAIIWFELATTVALVVGLVMMNVFQSGSRRDASDRADTHELATMAHAAAERRGTSCCISFRHSVVDAMARRRHPANRRALRRFFGIALAAVGEQGRPIVELLDSLAQVMFRVTGYVMRSPVGVLAAMAATVGGQGLGVLVTLGKLVLVMYASLAIFVRWSSVGGHSSSACRSGVSRTIREPFLIAFTTASSEAALPKSLEVMERFGVPKRSSASCCRPATA